MNTIAWKNYGLKERLSSTCNNADSFTQTIVILEDCLYGNDSLFDSDQECEMDQIPPPKLNKFVLVAVILFNLIWLTLLFLSCHADSKGVDSASPEAGFEDHLSGIKLIDLRLDSIERNDHQYFDQPT